MARTNRKPKASGLRALGLRVFNKLFLRSTILRTHKDVAGLSMQMRLMDKRIEYVIARMDAYAEAEDKIDAAFREEMRGRDEAKMAALSKIEAQTAEFTTRMEAISQEHHAGRLALEEGQARLVTDILNHNSQLFQAIDRNATLVHDTVRHMLLNEFRQREATRSLLRELHFGLDANLAEGAAEAPDYLLQLHRHIARRRPATVVALGCGLSTLVAAAALAAHGGRLYGVVEDQARAVAANEALAARGLSKTAMVRHASLSAWTPPKPTRLGNEWQWYKLPEEVEALETIDLVIVEGPSRAEAIYARYPAVPHLRARMIAGSAAIMPDAKRPDERAVATEWARLDDVRAEFLDDEVAGGLAEMVVPVVQ